MSVQMKQVLIIGIKDVLSTRPTATARGAQEGQRVFGCLVSLHIYFPVQKGVGVED
jgi:hypothetical protein